MRIDDDKWIKCKSKKLKAVYPTLSSYRMFHSFNVTLDNEWVVIGYIDFSFTDWKVAQKLLIDKPLFSSFRKCGKDIGQVVFGKIGWLGDNSILYGDTYWELDHALAKDDVFIRRRIREKAYSYLLKKASLNG